MRSRSQAFAFEFCSILKKTQPLNLKELRILHKFTGQKVLEILKSKRGSIKQAPLPEGSPSWDEFAQMYWEEIEAGVEANQAGFKVVRKLLSDKRFDK